MDTRFKLLPSSTVPQTFNPNCGLGYPDPTFMYNNICIAETGNYYTVIPLNSRMLRQALLADKELTLKLLGIRVFDKDENISETKALDKPVCKEQPAVKEKKLKTVTHKESTKDTIIIDGELSKKYGLPVGKEVDRALLATVKPKEE